MQLRVDPGWQNRMRAIDTQIEEVMRGVNRGWGGSERSNPLGPAIAIT